VQAETLAQDQLAAAASSDKSLVATVEQQQHRGGGGSGGGSVEGHFIAAMKSVVGQFNDKSASSKSYEEFISTGKE
jgi:hypothetical protein